MAGRQKPYGPNLDIAPVGQTTPVFRLLLGAIVQARRDVDSPQIGETGHLVSPRKARHLRKTARSFLDWVQAELRELREERELTNWIHDAIR